MSNNFARHVVLGVSSQHIEGTNQLPPLCCFENLAHGMTGSFVSDQAFLLDVKMVCAFTVLCLGVHFSLFMLLPLHHASEICELMFSLNKEKLVGTL